MAITINGTGTITGITAGGLPDAIITTAEIVDANITAAKLSGASSGSAPIYSARAWVSFIGTGTVTIRASGNVTSITDNGTGNYTVNFTTALPDANYSAVATGDATTALIAGTLSSSVAPTTTAIRIVTYNGVGAGTDCGFCNVAVFR
jgi:hypothetical protein